MTNKELLQDKMARARYSVITLADAMGLSRAGLYKKLEGKSEFKASEIQKITNLLCLTLDEQQEIFFNSFVA